MGKQAAGFSPRTKDATAGGGIDGARAVIAEIGCVENFTYGGRQKGNPQAAVRVVFEIEGLEKPWEDHYTFGKAEGFETIDDGYGIRSTANKTGLNKQSGAFFLLEALEAAAEASDLDIDDLVPVELDGFTFRPLEGRVVILTNKKFTPVDGESKDRAIPAKFVEAAAKNGKSGGKTNGNGKAAKGSSADDIEEKTIDAIKGLIEENTSVKKADVPNLVYNEFKKDPDAKAMMQWAFKESNLIAQSEGGDAAWSYDKKKGILRAVEF